MPMTSVRRQAADLESFLVGLRRELHREPEVGLDLPLTQAKVLQALDGLPLEISTGTDLSSVVAVLRGAGGDRTEVGRRPVVLLRGDMDALPVTEATGLTFSSTITGVMHACGHDLHTAMLVGSAHLLCRLREELAGDVIFMFQPGEESWDGAQKMIDEGVLEAAGRLPAASLALHVFTGIGERGRFFTKAGTIMAASDQLHVTVNGMGGHGSTPHLARDPVTAVADMVSALQTTVTRRFDIFDPVVITVGLLQGGTKANVIPEQARFEATVRTFSAEARQAVRRVVGPMLQGVAQSHGVDVLVDWVPGYPTTVNADAEIPLVEESVADVLGQGRFDVMDSPLAGAEDYSRVLQRVPGVFVGLGATPPDQAGDPAPFNHSPHAQFDEAVLADGTALYAAWALRRLALESGDQNSAGLATNRSRR